MIKRIIFGKKYFKLNKEGKIECLERDMVFLFPLLILSTIIHFLMLYIIFSHQIPTYTISYKDVAPEVLSTIKIEYDGLNLEEQKKAYSFLNDVKNIYLKNQEQIIFTNNISKYCSTCSGLNYGHGNKLIIKYSQYDFMTKTTLCHELLHTYLETENEEEIVRDLVNYNPCYY